MAAPPQGSKGQRASPGGTWEPPSNLEWIGSVSFGIEVASAWQCYLDKHVCCAFRVEVALLY